MPWNMTADSEQDFIDIEYSGPVTMSSLRQVAKEALALAGDRAQRFLTEFKDAELKLSLIDIFNLPDLFHSLGASRDAKSAVVMPKTCIRQEDAEFHEATCTNRGWQVRVFQDREAALGWLMRE